MAHQPAFFIIFARFLVSSFAVQRVLFTANAVIRATFQRRTFFRLCSLTFSNLTTPGVDIPMDWVNLQYTDRSNGT